MNDSIDSAKQAAEAIALLRELDLEFNYANRPFGVFDHCMSRGDELRRDAEIEDRRDDLRRRVVQFLDRVGK